jgi:hypothetical protein
MMRLGHLDQSAVALVLQDLDAHHVAVRPEHVEYCSNIRHLLPHQIKKDNISAGGTESVCFWASRIHIRIR